MSRRSFIEKWVYDGVKGSIERELDVVRSEYPLTVGEGWLRTTSGLENLLEVPSGKVFSLRSLIVSDVPSTGGSVFLLQGSSNVIFPVILTSGETKIITGLCGIRVTGSLNVSCNYSGIYVRVGGLLFDEE